MKQKVGQLALVVMGPLMPLHLSSSSLGCDVWEGVDLEGVRYKVSDTEAAQREKQGRCHELSQGCALVLKVLGNVDAVMCGKVWGEGGVERTANLTLWLAATLAVKAFLILATHSIVMKPLG